MNTFEQLAVLTAMEKAVKDRIKEVRSEANENLLEAYESMGVEKLALKVGGGTKVGEFIVTFNAEGFEVTDRAAFEDFALDYGLARVNRSIRPDMMESCIRALEGVFSEEVLAEAVEERVELNPDWEKAIYNIAGVPCYEDSGMPVPGLAVRPKTVKSTMVRGCKPVEVLPLAFEGGAATLLLGGDTE